MQPVIPPAIEEVISKFDNDASVFDEHQVNQALIAARKTLTDPSEAESLGAWAEVLAFALAHGKHGSSPWGTYFRPFASGTKQDGSTFYSPDITGTDAEVVAHWTQRAGTVKQPVLKARYADLAWDMSRAIAKTNPDPKMARTAIDAYLASVTGNRRRDVHDKFDAALRALNLSVTIGDNTRRDAARAVLLDIHRETGNPRGQIYFLFGRTVRSAPLFTCPLRRDILEKNCTPKTPHPRSARALRFAWSSKSRTSGRSDWQ
jgi:lysyl-tRNA synthetase class 1